MQVTKVVQRAVNKTDEIADLLSSQKVPGEEPSYIKTSSVVLGIVRNQPWNMPYNYVSGNGNFSLPDKMPIFQNSGSDMSVYLDASVSID